MELLSGLYLSLRKNTLFISTLLEEQAMDCFVCNDDLGALVLLTGVYTVHIVFYCLISTGLGMICLLSFILS